MWKNRDMIKNRILFANETVEKRKPYGDAHRKDNRVIRAAAQKTNQQRMPGSRSNADRFLRGVARMELRT
jgi:hypothetical protein